MIHINRRTFIGHTAKTIGAAWLATQLPTALAAQGFLKPATQPIGFQVYPIRDQLAKDFSGTLKKMAGLGYQTVEMCSPPGYVDSGFGPLVNMKTATMRDIIREAGLACPSCHFTFGELKDHLEERMEFARPLGLTQMICSSFWLPQDASVQDYQKAADELNKIGETTKKAGFQMGYHNHEMEFAQRDGMLIYDALMDRLDPQLVKMQFQTEVINLGYKAATYFTKYPGRFISAHLTDWTPEKKQAPIGQGVIDWKEFFTAAKTGGVKNFFVEMNQDTFEESAKYIHNLNLA